MRIWSLHPRYLDPKGLVALWRETLLAQKVLQGQAKGYRNHPQLARFRRQADPVAAIAAYLQSVHDEAVRRGYCFDRIKIAPHDVVPCIPVTQGQLLYEREHLGKKLMVRDRLKHKELLSEHMPEPHPLFFIVEGGVEEWEVTRDRA